MTKFARTQDGLVVEIIETEHSIEDLFHPDLASTFFEATKDVDLGWKYADNVFSPPDAISIDTIRANKIASMAAMCATTIVGGYASSALGEPHNYPSKSTDQINMMGSVTNSLLPDIADDWTTPFWCEDSKGIWAFRPHTAAQIQKAGADAKAHIVRCQSTLDELTAAINSAKTIKAVDAVAWPTSMA